MRINFFGGPCSSKSTTAASLFSSLKKNNYNCELVAEYVKSWCWEGRTIESWDQHYVFAKQLHAEDILLRKNIIVISDSPLLMQCAYMARNNDVFLPEKLSECRKWEELHPSCNFYLKRTVHYKKEGRYENQEQAEEVDEIIKKMLLDNKVDYHTVDPLNFSNILDIAINFIGR